MYIAYFCSSWETWYHRTDSNNKTRFDFMSKDASDSNISPLHHNRCQCQPHVPANTKLLKTSWRKKSRLSKTVYFDWQPLQSLFRLKNVKKSISINLIKTPSDTKGLQQKNNCWISKKVQFQPTVILIWNSFLCLQLVSNVIQWKPLFCNHFGAERNWYH